MISALSKAAFSTLAGSRTLKRLASRYGMRRPDSFARRFVAGETIDDAIDVSRDLERRGFHVTLDYLGEHLKSREGATEATRAYIAVADAMVKAGIGRNLSLKLTQLGLDIDRATAIDNIRRILESVIGQDVFVRIDMENAKYLEETLETFETLWSIGYRDVGLVIQAYLRKAPEYVRRLNTLGARVRLVKGAYRESGKIVFTDKRDVDYQFIELTKLLLSEGTYPAIATHDPAMISATQAFAAAHDIAKARFEFQMLYGIRRDLQTSLVAAGHAFRVYVPFGRDWFPYFMRRLGERPANVGFVLKSLVRGS